MDWYDEEYEPEKFDIQVVNRVFQGWGDPEGPHV